MNHLSHLTLPNLPANILRPSYDRDVCGIGIVHLGAGAFHRAHQAVYSDRVLEQDGGDWSIIGASLRGKGVYDQLTPQDGLFSVTSRSGAGNDTRVVGALKSILYAPDDPGALLARMAAESTRIVSLTVTEKGYCRHPASGGLIDDDPDIAHDLQNPENSRTAIGFLVRALDLRRRSGVAPFTVLSCDNLPDNGRSLRQVAVEFAGQVSDDLGAWIVDNACFPCTMVDRIVPATTKDDLAFISTALGCTDAGAVFTEPFTQWVIEDSFTLGRPAWEKAGALLVDDVAPYELMKLRLLNGAHSSLAYLGYLSGFEYVSDCMDNRPMRDFISALMRIEIGETLVPPSGFDRDAYTGDLLARFANPALKHRCWQIAMDGSQKLPQRLLGTIRDRLGRGLPIDRLALAVVAWLQYASGQNLEGAKIDVRDPLAVRLRTRLQPCLGNSETMIDTALGVVEVFGNDLATHPAFRGILVNALISLETHGALGAVARVAVP